MRIVAALLDVPDHQIDMLKAWSDDFISYVLEISSHASRQLSR
jgi:hypothetical protein